MGRYPIRYEIAPGAIETLIALVNSGMNLGIVSNNRASIRETLDSLGLSELFRTIVISEEVGLYKPDPRILKYACDKPNTDCSDALYVGDHPFDVVCAHEANMQAAWIPANEFMRLPKGTAEPEHRLCLLTDLLNRI